MNKEKQAYDYHSRMMNIQLNNESKDAEIQKDRGYEMMYKIGHRDARHVAAKIAIEADQEIAALKAAITAEREETKQLLGAVEQYLASPNSKAALQVLKNAFDYHAEPSESEEE